MILLGYRDEYSHVPLGKQGESERPHTEAGLSPLIATLLFNYMKSVQIEVVYYQRFQERT